LHLLGAHHEQQSSLNTRRLEVALRLLEVRALLGCRKSSEALLRVEEALVWFQSQARSTETCVKFTGGSEGGKQQEEGFIQLDLQDRSSNGDPDCRKEQWQTLPFLVVQAECLIQLGDISKALPLLTRSIAELKRLHPDQKRELRVGTKELERLGELLYHAQQRQQQQEEGPSSSY